MLIMGTSPQEDGEWGGGGGGEKKSLFIFI